MSKFLVKERFRKCLKTYDDNAIVQKIMAQNLVSELEQKKYNKVLEIGCGTGILTN